MSSSSSSRRAITVGYWAMRGLAAPIRMMIMYRRVPLQCVNYEVVENTKKNGFDRSAWSAPKAELKQRHPLINLPYIIDNGEIVTQSNAIMLYLGRRLGLLGAPPNPSQCEQLLMECQDMRIKVSNFAYGRDNTPAQEWLNSMVDENSQSSKLNTWLARKYGESGLSDGDSLVFVGNEPSIPDFHIWEVIDLIKSVALFNSCADPIKQSLPFLDRFHSSFAALPDNQAYLHSKLYALPANNPHALRYGATPTGDKWRFGETKMTWSGSSGLYLNDLNYMKAKL